MPRRSGRWRGKVRRDRHMAGPARRRLVTIAGGLVLAAMVVTYIVTKAFRVPTELAMFAAAIAGALTLAIMSLKPSYLSTPVEAIGRLPFTRSISLNRILVLLGLETSPVLIAAILGLVVIVVVRLYPMSRQTLLCFGGCAAAMAVPIDCRCAMNPLQKMKLRNTRNTRMRSDQQFPADFAAVYDFDRSIAGRIAVESLVGAAKARLE